MALNLASRVVEWRSSRLAGRAAVRVEVRAVVSRNNPEWRPGRDRRRASISLSFLRPVQADVRGRQEGAIGADLDGGAFIFGGEDEAGDVASYFRWRWRQSSSFVSVELAEIVFEDVGELAAPAVAAIVGVQAIAEAWLAAFCIWMVSVCRHGGRARAQLRCRRWIPGIPDLFKEIGSEIVARYCEMKAEGRLSLWLLLRQPVIFPSSRIWWRTRLRRARARHGRRGGEIDRAANHARKERGFLELEIADGLAEIELRGAAETVIAVERDRPGWRTCEDLRLGVAALDCCRAEEDFLGFAAEAAIAGGTRKRLPAS